MAHSSWSPIFNNYLKKKHLCTLVDSRAKNNVISPQQMYSIEMQTGYINGLHLNVLDFGLVGDDFVPYE